MTPDAHRRGRSAEDAASAALEAAGYRVIETNFRVTGAELDIVARDPDGIVFVEVRARARGAEDPSATITGAKLRTLLRGARSWLSMHDIPDDFWRFVVVSVELDDDGRPTSTTILDDPFAHSPEYHRGDP